MKKFLVSLLIVCSLVLCGFVAFQWLREARLRADVQKLTIESHSKTESIANLEGSIKTLQNEISRLDALKTELTEATKTQRQEISEMRIELRKVAGENENLSQQVDSYKDALTQANENIRRQNEGIEKQNSELKRMVEERNEAILKQNEVVHRYNELVKQFNEVQELLKVRSSTAGQ
ncbi:MAG: hypothetical protein ACK4UN_11210 [Limisphaerales bacterium]